LDTDPDKLREVLVNLLHNAIEYNRPGGSVELAGCRSNGHVVLEVRDTGIGMAPDVREKIFERFYRADPSRHAPGAGAGGGLAIDKERGEGPAGPLPAETAPGEGSPSRAAPPAPAAAEPAHGAPATDAPARVG